MALKPVDGLPNHTGPSQSTALPQRKLAGASEERSAESDALAKICTSKFLGRDSLRKPVLPYWTAAAPTPDPADGA